MGLPKSVKKFRSILYSIKRRSKKKYTANKDRQLSNKDKSSIVNSFFSLLVSVIKLLKNLQISYLKKRGYIILTDRFPLEGIYDDLPQWKISYFRNFEKKLNKKFKLPNKLFFLSVDKKILELRKPESYQDNYKIKLKIQQNLTEYAEKNDLVKVLDNSKNLNLNSFIIIDEIFKEINNDN